MSEEEESEQIKEILFIEKNSDDDKSVSGAGEEEESGTLSYSDIFEPSTELEQIYEELGVRRRYIPQPTTKEKAKKKDKKDNSQNVNNNRVQQRRHPQQSKCCNLT